MKHLIQIIGLISMALILIIAIMIVKYMNMRKEFSEEISKTAFINIIQKVKIEGLKQVEINFCDTSYIFSQQQIYDTVNEKFNTDGKFMPCNVVFKYVFKDKNIKKIDTDSFNCFGCSGTSYYQLYADSVVYNYLP